MTKNQYTIISLLILIIVLSNSVMGLGVTPARRVIDYVPGQTINYEFTILNTEETDQILAVYTTGALQNSIVLEKNIIRVDKSQGKASVKLTVTLPEGLEPGTQKTNIMVAGLPSDAGINNDLESEVFSGNLNGNIGASIVVAHQLWVEVPYPGKYLKAQIRKQEFDSKPEFVIAAFNLGTERLDDIDARVEILGATFEEIAELKTNSISLESGTEGKLTAVWDEENINPGVYRVRAIVNYDSKTIVLEDNFYVGKSQVEIKSLTANNFRLGTIAKLNLLIESDWNNPINEVYGEFNVLQNGEKIGNFLTAPISLQPYQEETLIGYWDTEGYEIGDYDIQVKVKYEGKTEERIFDAALAIDSIEFGNNGIGRVTGNDSDKSSNSTALLIILMLVLVGLNIALFLYIKRSKK